MLPVKIKKVISIDWVVDNHNLILSNKQSLIIIKIDISESRNLIIEPIQVKIISFPNQLSYEHILVVFTNDLNSISISLKLHITPVSYLNPLEFTSIFHIKHVKPIISIKHVNPILLTSDIHKVWSQCLKIGKELLFTDFIPIQWVGIDRWST